MSYRHRSQQARASLPVAIPALLPQMRIDLTREELVAEHESQILRRTRLLLQRRADAETDRDDDRGRHASDRIEETDSV